MYHTSRFAHAAYRREQEFIQIIADAVASAGHKVLFAGSETDGLLAVIQRRDGKLIVVDGFRGAAEYANSQDKEKYAHVACRYTGECWAKKLGVELSC